MTSETPPDFSVSAPASLLIMGEYAVLEEGGLGIAVAPDVRVTATARTGGAPGGQSPGIPDGISIVGHLPEATVNWPGEPGTRADGILGRAADFLKEHYRPKPGAVRIDLHSEAFFSQDGRKRGLGSSAAVVVAISAIWLRLTGNLPAESDRSRQTVFTTGVAAHRAAQGGKGSGYDVGCSACGGITLFSGGDHPAAERVELPWLPAIRMIEGPKAVSTVDAVSAYRRWKRESPRAARDYLVESNRLVSAFAGARDWQSGAAILAEYRDLTVNLGSAIGVPATIEKSEWVPNDDAIVKAVGAGNELGVALSRDLRSGEGEDSHAMPNGKYVVIARDGLTWG